MWQRVVQLIIYQHAVLIAPPVATLIKAINNKWLTSFPGMNVDNARRHLPKSIQTSMGHLARVRKNVRWTKETEPTVDELMNEEEKDPEIIPPRKQPLNQEHQVGIHVIDFE